jgi:hypothetical protein
VCDTSKPHRVTPQGAWIRTARKREFFFTGKTDFREGLGRTIVYYDVDASRRE